MNKSDLVDILWREFPEFRRRDLELIVNLLFERLTQALKDEERIEIRGFGRFIVKRQKERFFKNPRTGEEQIIPTRKRVIFKVGKDLKERLNQHALASIDLGTQTFRLLIGKASEGDFKILLKERFNVRLGEKLTKEGRISEKAHERGIKALKKIRLLLDKAEVKEVFAAGTEVFRKAQNADYFLEQAQKILGTPVKILSPEEEALYTAKGVLFSLKPESSPVLIIDVGGGSTEYILCHHEKPIKIGSLKLGAVTLKEKFFPSDDIPTSKEMEEAKNEITNFLEEIKYLSPAPHSLIATGGTATCLAALAQGLERYSPAKVHGYFLKTEKLKELVQKLASLSSSEIKFLKGMEEGREDIILPGALIYSALADILNSKGFLISETGILEGLLLHLIEKRPIISENI
ncbi:Ppx/GppA phosphatase [Thermodesulfatator indicus DSM 15286]|uniref:Ppx/GppA phosphatase n=2 Tax=Thermodesulfatator indicus TaxID=171695 RepID=F8A8Y5_THEID|nr:Ppx/GppA phosphatase [Thermodesulfatator indicus DSM 15286]